MNSTIVNSSLEFRSQLKVNLALWVFMGTAFLVWYCQYLWSRRKLYVLSKTVSGPKGIPIFGNLFDFAGSCDQIYETIIRYFNTFPKLFKVWFGPRLVYAVSQPEYIEKILTNSKAFEKHELFQYVKPVLGNGLFTAPVLIWKKHKKLILPAFTQKILNTYVEIFASKSLVFAKILENFANKKEFDVYETVNRCTLDIICETTMGISVNAQVSKSPFGYWIDRLLEIAFLRIFVVWYHSDFIFRMTNLYHEHTKLLQELNNFTDKVIKDKKQQLEKNLHNSEKTKSFLQLLLEDNKMSDIEIRDEVKTFMTGGTDTTSTSTSFALVMLGMHPEIQEMVYQEVVDVLGTRDYIEFNDLPKLQITERFIKESLRLFPVGVIIGREISEDIQLEENLICPGGSSILIGILPVHRNPEIYPDPLKFDPDRFLPEEIAKRHPYSYLAFSKSYRSCTGVFFAMMVMKTILATLIKKYKFSTSYKNIEDIKLTTNIVLKPQQGFKISLKLRD